MKGIMWLPVAIGIIFLSQILIFSLLFTQVTTFNREIVDSNVVFEGDELETYTRSLSNAIQVSTAQGMYSFYLDNNEKYWKGEGGIMPDQSSIEGSVLGYSKVYIQKFVDLYPEFQSEVPDNEKIKFILPEASEESEKLVGFIEIQPEGVYVKFADKILLEKGPIDFGKANFKREFVPESVLISVFGKMLDDIRSKLINGDEIGNYVREAAGKPESGEKTKCDVTPSSFGNRESHSTTELSSYIDKDIGVPSDNSEFAWLTPHAAPGGGYAQKGTHGRLRFCNLDVRRDKLCRCDDPCKNPEPIPTMNDPSPQILYEMTHTQTYSSGTDLIEKYATERLVCLESELDKESNEYTAAFDGDNRKVALGDHTIVAESSIVDVATSLTNEDITCGPGVNVGDCGSCPTPGGGSKPKIYYECPIIHERSYNYDHVITGDATIRFQEDGFVYGLIRGEDMVSDNIKLVFKIKSGN